MREGYQIGTRTYLLLATVMLVFTLVLSQPVIANTIEEKELIASQLYQAPGAQWEVYDQPFWKHWTILQLISSDLATLVPGPYPRPFVAVDEQGAGYLLTNMNDGDREAALENFNQLALQEAIEVTANNIEEYAHFFIQVYGGLRFEFLEARSGYLKRHFEKDETKPKLEEQLDVSDRLMHVTGYPFAEHFFVNYTWHNGYWVPSQVLIYRNGTVELKDVSTRETSRPINSTRIR